MLTGYFQIYKEKFSLKKVVLETIFYGWLIGIIYVGMTIFGLVENRRNITIDVLFKTFLDPVSSGIWWFVTIYVLVLLISPVMNEILHRLTKQGTICFLGISWLFWYAIAYFINVHYVNVYRGFLFYILGAVCRLYIKSIDRSKWIYVAMFSISWCLGAGLYYEIAVVQLLPDNMSTKMIAVLCRTVYFSIVVPVCSVSVFRFFEMWNCKINRIVNRFAETMFGVYLLSNSEITRDILWHGILKIEVFWYESSLFPLWAIFIIIGVIIICSIVDIMRINFIEPLMMSKSEKVIEIMRAKCCKNF